MDSKVCSQCGKEIEGPGIQHRKRFFCSDECCDEFAVELASAGEPEVIDLDDDDADDVLDVDLGYRGDDLDPDDDDDLDDEFAIDPDDF